MGQYESVRVGASVELEVDEATANLTDVYTQLDTVLAEAMEHDLNEAISLLPPGSSSYILSWGNTDNA